MNEYDPEMQFVAPALCLPDDRKEWAAWLEKQILSLQLTTLVEQLITLGSNHPPEITFQAWLANDQDNVMKYGLQKHVDTPRIELVVRNPALLLDLQQLVLLEGEEYWLQLPKLQSQIDQSVCNQVLARIAKPNNSPENVAIAATQNKTAISTFDTDVSESSRNLTIASTATNKRALWTALVAVTAAAIMLVIFNPFYDSKRGEFFAATELQMPAETPKLALNRMAQRVRSDWKRDTGSSYNLKQQLIAFRDSCDLLIDGPLVQTLDGMPIETIEDVRNRCRKWKTRATELIASIETGASLDTIQQEANTMIETLTNKLEEIAQS